MSFDSQRGVVSGDNSKGENFAIMLGTDVQARDEVSRWCEGLK